MKVDNYENGDIITIPSIMTTSSDTDYYIYKSNLNNGTVYYLLNIDINNKVFTNEKMKPVDRFDKEDIKYLIYSKFNDGYIFCDDYGVSCGSTLSKDQLTISEENVEFEFYNGNFKFSKEISLETYPFEEFLCKPGKENMVFGLDNSYSGAGYYPNLDK